MTQRAARSRRNARCSAFRSALPMRMALAHVAGGTTGTWHLQHVYIALKVAATTLHGFRAGLTAASVSLSRPVDPVSRSSKSTRRRFRIHSVHRCAAATVHGRLRPSLSRTSDNQRSERVKRAWQIAGAFTKAQMRFRLFAGVPPLKNTPGGSPYPPGEPRLRGRLAVDGARQMPDQTGTSLFNATARSRIAGGTHHGA